MAKVTWLDKLTNQAVLNKLDIQKSLLRKVAVRKTSYAGHVLRGSSGVTSLLILKGCIEGQRCRRRQRRTWVDDIKKWTNLSSYGQIKRAAEDRATWRSRTVNLHLEEDT